ncbi:diuretic hormone receptor [Caerostris darwini]|uniref:Diuretic hormone receptor n=1 Tax=Caerostris darwini TaxID=1538125 RepID=A0AAV4N108_9ARAC|nr:diuretic hormone receptor [Caerostris darwini]
MAEIEGTNETGCPAAWDNLFCWPPTPVNTTVRLPCAHIFPFLQQDNDTDALAFRRCDAQGHWADGGWTNYSECEKLDFQEEPEAISPTSIGIVVLSLSSLSLVCLCAALAVFSAFRSLECARVRVHRHLLLSLLLHALMLVVVSGAALHPGRFLSQIDWLCKAVLVLKTYSAMASVNWMFVEGLLLHASITTSVFDRRPPFRLYHALGWGIPALCVLTWVALMSFHWSKACWVGYGHALSFGSSLDP